MPIYEYRCGACGELFEELVLSSSERVKCPACKSRRVVQQMSAFAFKSSGGFISSAGRSCSGCSAGSCGGCSGCGGG